MSPTAKTDDDPPLHSRATVSGKHLIIGIFILAVSLAAASWWFRYSATHRAVDLWGPKAARLIRDAPRVDFFRIETGNSAIPETGRIPLKSGGMVKAWDQRIVSNAPGLTYLRYALLEDHSFQWPARVPENDPHWQWALLFRNDFPGGTQTESEWVNRFKQFMDDNSDVRMVFILFTKDCTEATLIESADGKVISCQPIAKGLREMFGEFTAASSADGGAKPQSANEAAAPAR